MADIGFFMCSYSLAEWGLFSEKMWEGDGVMVLSFYSILRFAPLHNLCREIKRAVKTF